MLTLKNVLTINALSSGATGLLLIAFADLFARWFGLDVPSLFVGVGIFLVAFAAFVFFVSRQSANTALVKVVIALDVAWVIASALVITVDRAFISGLGIFMIIAVALWVTAMAYLQKRGLKTIVNTVVLMLVASVATLAQPKASNKPVDVVHAFIDAVQHDHKKIPALLDSAMQWHQPGNNQLSGVRNNLKEVFQLFGSFKQL